MISEVPVLNKEYFAYSEGRINSARSIRLAVTAVHPFSSAPAKYVKKWHNMIADHDHLDWTLYKHLNENTDYIVVGEYDWKYNNKKMKHETILFARAKSGEWYSFDGEECILDVDNSLTVGVLSEEVENLWNWVLAHNDEINTLKKNKQNLKNRNKKK